LIRSLTQTLEKGTDQQAARTLTLCDLDTVL
jgi:hypothetical protein